MAAPGDIVANKYRLDWLIGRGAFASVWAATNTYLDRQIALKLIHPEVAADETAVARLMREAKLAAAGCDVVRVAVAKPLHQLFDYAVPPDMTPPVAGARVVVPFGRQRLTAICVERNPDDAHAQLKPLLSVLDDTAAIPEELRALAGWLCDYYQHPLGEVLATMLPAEARRGHELTIVRPEQWTATGR